MDIITFGSDRPRPRPPRHLVVIGVVLVLAAALAAVAVGAFDDDDARPGAVRSVAPTTPESPLPVDPPCEVQLAGAWETMAAVVIDDEDALSRHTLQSCDRTAAEGPWAVVVRRGDGSLGRHGAVVTFPVAAPTAGRAVTIGKVVGLAADGVLIWPLAGAYARVRGDLCEADLFAIAARTTVRSGRPVVPVPPAGYAVVSTGTYRPTVVREARYGSAMLGEQAALGAGLTLTVLADGAAVEDQLYASGATDAGRVRGSPAVVSSTLGGNGALAWEPAPGVVAWVGYSGVELHDGAVAALRRLAERARVLTGTQWRTTGAQTINRVNDIG